MKSISVDDLAAPGSDVSMIDVREEKEYLEAYVPGILNVPFSVFQQSLGDVPIGRTVYEMCASGGRSSLVIEHLAGESYDAVKCHGWHQRVVPQRSFGHYQTRGM